MVSLKRGAGKGAIGPGKAISHNLIMFKTKSEVQNVCQNGREKRRRLRNQGSGGEGESDKGSGGFRDPSNSEESVRSCRRLKDTSSAADTENGNHHQVQKHT
jgi:hypothetical protein